MYFNVKRVEVHRKNIPAPGEDPVWTLVGVVYGTTVPIGGTDAIRNNQMFADIKRRFTGDLVYRGVDQSFVRTNDEFLYPDGKSYRVRSVEVYDAVLPHIECYLGDTQWQRGV